MYLQVKCASVERLFRYFIFFTCLGIVTWQCWKCCTKFRSKPQGTKLSIVNSAGNMFPSVTFCPYPDPKEDTKYNSTILSNCGITRNQYFVIWSNQTIENCRNPKSLYYNIIWKLDELVSKVIIYSFNMSSIVFKDNKTTVFSPIDTHNYGRCYTFLPPEQNLIDGIYRMKFTLKAKARVFVENNGVFGVKRSAEDNFLDVSPLEKYHVKIDHNLYKMLDNQGVPKKKKKGYLLNKCVLNELEKESLKMIGCVSPFGITKDNICENEQVSKKAFLLYKRFKNKEDLTKLSCLEPCTYMSVKIIKATSLEKVSTDEIGKLLLHFNGQVHETVAYYSYDDLSFIAEIGGYVGLFLGASMYQTADLFDTIIRNVRISRN